VGVVVCGYSRRNVSGSGTPDAGSLYRFDPATGASTKMGVTGGFFDIMDLAWHPDGTMYGAVNDSLYRIEATTGQATLVTKLHGVSAGMVWSLTTSATSTCPRS
jgi:sugar lactone lactonase YvrE